jgi:23S rRNA (cytidine1920-2'-O)/16S rRNA (cytidine1409-2'-O)-methyltransferase
VDVDQQRATRPAQKVHADAAITVRDTSPGYVSRGALKLKAALDHWRIDPKGLVAVDIGASTGGFTDLLLQRGATRVYSVDVGYGQLHYRLRGDPRVVVMERVNARHLEALPESPDLCVVDVSFISLRLVLPPAFALLKSEAPVIALVKPQFEAGRAQVGKGGVVRDPGVREQVLRELEQWSRIQPWQMEETLRSPITGPAGNVEFLSLWRKQR